MAFGKDIIGLGNVVQKGYSKKFEVLNDTVGVKIIEDFSYSFRYFKNSGLGASSFDGDIGFRSGGDIIDTDDIIGFQKNNTNLNVTVGGDIINGCVISNFSMNEGNLVNDVSYDITYTKETSSPELSKLGALWIDVGSALDKKLIEQFSESTSLTKSVNSYNFSKQITVKVSASLLGQPAGANAMSAAKSIINAAKAYDDSNGISSSFKVSTSDEDLDKLTESNYRADVTISADNINGTATYNRSFSSVNLEGADYSHTYSKTFEINKTKDANASENGIFKATKKTQTGTSLKAIYENKREEIYNRLKNLINSSDACPPYIDCNTGGDLIFDSEEVTVNDIDHEVRYSCTIKNDKEIIDQSSCAGYKEKYVTEETEASGEKITSKKGTIIGWKGKSYDNTKSGINKYPKFIYAFNRFTSIATQKILNNGQRKGMISHSQTFSPSEASIEFEVAYSDLPKYNEDEKYKIYSISKSTSNPVQGKNEFIVPLQSFPIMQKKSIMTPSQKSVTIEVVGRGNLVGDIYSEVSSKAQEDAKDQLEADAKVESFSENWTKYSELTYGCQLNALEYE